jgi:hypothetical protein
LIWAFPLLNLLNWNETLPGGDKPRPYLLDKGSSVGAGFIPTRKFAWFKKDLPEESLSLGFIIIDRIPSIFIRQ